MLDSVLPSVMKITVYHVDVFTDKLFSGNPAAVCILEKWLPETLLQKIAEENNLPATAFLVQVNNKIYTRWFGPEYEIDLCGHGSLASGYVIFNILQPTLQSINLIHPVVGELRIANKDSFICLNFPVKQIESATSSILENGLGVVPKEIYQHKNERIVAILTSEEEVRELKPNMDLLKQLEHRGIIVTAKGKTVDFVSRVFYPKKVIFEDAVTGSALCLIGPYWSKQLNKDSLRARQLSKRGGETFIELQEDRVQISGKAILYMQGTIHV